MRIAIVSDAIMPYNNGGKEQRIAQLSRRMADAGHDVHIYTMKWWDGPKVVQEHGVWLHGIMKKRPLYHGERRSISEGVFFGAAAFKLLFAKFDLADVDHMPYFPLYSMWLVCLLKRKPMFATWHEVWSKTYWQGYLGKAPGALAYAIEKTSSMLPSKILAVSALTAKRLTSVYGTPKGKVLLAPNGVDSAEIVAVVKKADISSDVIFTGRLLANKNVNMLIKAVGLVSKDLPNIRCVIVGEGPEKKRLQKLVNTLGIEKRVAFVPFQKDHAAVLAYMKASKVFVSASSREGFGIVAVEANGCGLPVLTLDHEDNATTYLITPENGALFNTAAELADLLKDYLNRPHDSQKIIATARKYDWQNTVGTVLKGYAA